MNCYRSRFRTLLLAAALTSGPGLAWAQTDTSGAEQNATAGVSNEVAETPTEEMRDSIPGVVDWSVAVQLFSLNSTDAAEKGWNRIKNRHQDLLGDMELLIKEVDLDDRGVFYRGQIVPFPNQATALDLCSQLKARKQDCLVVRR